MREALDEARRAGPDQSEPARRRGLVRDGEIVGRGHHIYAGWKHAEIVAIEAGRREGARARRCTSRSSPARIRAGRRPAPTR